MAEACSDSSDGGGLLLTVPDAGVDSGCDCSRKRCAGGNCTPQACLGRLPGIAPASCAGVVLHHGGARKRGQAMPRAKCTEGVYPAGFYPDDSGQQLPRK